MQQQTEQDSVEIRRHNLRQQAYYAQRKPVRMDVTDTPYVRLHFDRAAEACGLRPGESVLEVGAGMGRFTRIFAERGHAVTAVELSPVLAADCRTNLAKWSHATVLGADLLDAPRLLTQRFDVLAGFFMLHHLTCLDRHFAAVRSLLKPGGRCVFVEPNPWNPLYAVQVTCTPGMRWREEAGIYRMWPGMLRRAMTNAGLVGFGLRRHGFFPRWLHNRCEEAGLNPWLEKLTPSGLRPFEVISAHAPAANE